MAAVSGLPSFLAAITLMAVSRPMHAGKATPIRNAWKSLTLVIAAAPVRVIEAEVEQEKGRPLLEGRPQEAMTLSTTGYGIATCAVCAVVHQARSRVSSGSRTIPLSTPLRRGTRNQPCSVSGS